MEDQGAKLRQILVSKESFKEAYLVRGRLVGREGGKGVRGEGGEVGGREEREEEFGRVLNVRDCMCVRWFLLRCWGRW